MGGLRHRSEQPPLGLQEMPEELEQDQARGLDEDHQPLDENSNEVAEHDDQQPSDRLLYASSQRYDGVREGRVS